MNKPTFCPGPFSRRNFLKFGGLTLAGMSLSESLRFKAMAAEDPSILPRDTSVIFVWLPGGPPHMETYDMKPDAPLEYRGIFKPMKTNVPGTHMTELFPLQAKIADKFNIIRSCCHEFADHGGGHKRFMTGRVPAQPTGFVNDAPAVTSIIHKLMTEKSGFKDGMPPVVVGVDGGRQGIDTFSLGASYLGGANTPFVVPGDPSLKDFKVQNLGISRDLETRLEDRMALRKSLDHLRRDIDQSGVMSAMDTFSQNALQMLTSEKVRDAFDLSKEPLRVRERYGMHAYGQRGLMARRLIEAGCRFVEMVWEHPYPGKPTPNDCSYNWDSHAVNCHIFNDAHWRFPPYDQAASALIEDLFARGLDKNTMVILTGEFGRTPKLSQSVGTSSKIMQPGRDHWPGAMSMIVTGGGMRTGQIIGATNSKGEYPIERPLSPNDLWATVYQHLGIDYTRSFLDHQGRPMPILPFGEPIQELLPTRA
ncbi:MAG: DUF1501 domain-containing protein [Planctomycetota bacterium]